MSDKADRLRLAGANDIISLAVGEPGFFSPDIVKASAISAIKNNHTQYTPVAGLFALRQAIVRHYQKNYHLDFAMDEVFVTSGAKHSLHNIFNCLLNPDDEVIVFSPFWTSYPEMIRLSQGKSVIVATSHKYDFQPQKEALLSALNNKTKAIILNSPNNPTGAIYTQKTLQMFAEVLKDYPDIWVISDDIYQMVYWDKRPLSLLEVAPELKSRYVIANGVSKSYAMAGWRVGYTLAPADLTQAMGKFQSQSTSCACSISQYACIDALSLTHDDISDQIQMYRDRVRFVYERLKDIDGVNCIVPQSTFYVFPYIKPLLEKLGFADDMAFCLQLLEAKHVAVMPGSVYGGDGYLRLSCADNLDVLDEAMRRFVDFVRQ
ncbi:pyridoxal phosphate-dependent aminotransferase [Facilibium subflavum]|uniref:pyridoxal phosphate-dependent aminotransferase n=1 Tax=Facilibium subflavum TaxID=2219058 RepID=UPI001F392CEA|nr:pyridoxal phosphate-dependent aminotransferase [Facilibium subflavum]